MAKVKAPSNQCRPDGGPFDKAADSTKNLRLSSI